jgi:hypothetical protein
MAKGILESGQERLFPGVLHDWFVLKSAAKVRRLYYKTATKLLQNDYIFVLSDYFFYFHIQGRPLTEAGLLTK